MITIQPLTTSNWNDFVTLMQTDTQCAECWCLNHREPAGCPTGEQAKTRMQQLTNENKVKGLLAFNNQAECVGWIAVDPIDKLSGHDCQSTGKPEEWSIHCMVIKNGFRGQGISTELIRAAIQFAKANGAIVISAFPIPQENRGKFPANVAEFSGRHSTFAKFGFTAQGDPTDFYQRMELE